MNPKVIDNLINKIGITPVQAVWIMGISEKYAVWIANQVKANPEIFPKGGSSLKKIIAWKQKNPGIDINEYDYRSAFEATVGSAKKHFKKAPGSLKNEKVVAVCEGSEYKWVEIKTQADCEEEGEYMNHCLSENQEYLEHGARVFSLRDEYNKPVITTQITKEGHIGQYSANSNETPSERMHKYFEFLEKQAGLTVNELSKYERGIQKTAPKLPQVWEGDLALDYAATIPEGFTVNGNLTISCEGRKVIELPKGVKIKNSLVIESNVSIPQDIEIGGDLLISEGKVTINDGVKVGNDVRFDGGSVSLGGELNVGRDLVINSPLSAEHGIDVKRDIIINADVVLPKSLKVGCNLTICAVTVLPESLSVGRNLDIRNRSVAIPKGLTITKDLVLRETSSIKVPDGTVIGGDLLLGRRPIDANIKNIGLGGTVKVI